MISFLRRKGKEKFKVLRLKFQVFAAEEGIFHIIYINVCAQSPFLPTLHCAYRSV